MHKLYIVQQIANELCSIESANLATKDLRSDYHFFI